ncbi:MAG: nucleotide exchange factor GrpE [Nitrospinae bacterium]|nr:nucleotide exchange factor GrpE [Nitrospinota bacterium]
MKEEVITAKKKESEEPEAPQFTVKDKRFWATEEKGGEAPVEEKLPTYVEQLQKQAEESEKKLKEYIAAYKQKMAENDEFRKRLEINYQKRAEQINADFLLNLIPVVDNLERAISSAEKVKDFDSLLQGIKMTQTLFLNQLKNSGVEKIEACGKTFNPENEEAVEVIEVNEKDKDNIVIEELESGYKIKDKLIRPTKVRVGKYSDKSSAAGTTV